MTIEACPSCHSPRTHVIESRTFSNDARRRRHECHDCLVRWTSHVGTPPPRGPRPVKKGETRPRRVALSEDEVRQILTDVLVLGQSCASVGRRVGRSRTAISAITHGDWFSDYCPEIVRRRPPRLAHRRRHRPGDPVCPQCIHWLSGRCGMGIPEATLDGEQFAAECAAFFGGTDPVL